MKKFKIATQWIVCADVEVEAETLEEAMQKARQIDTLPVEDDYLNGSYEVNEELTREINK